MAFGSILEGRQVLFALFAAVIGLTIAYYINFAYEEYWGNRNDKLVVAKSTIAPVSKLSGLYVDHQSGDFFGVGDSEARFFAGHVSDDAIGIESSVGFGDDLIDRFLLCPSKRVPACRKMREMLTSGWEAITADSSGRTFILSKDLATIVVYDRNRKEVSATLNLDGFHPGGISHQGLTPDQTEQALGEGLVLLRNGHILVSKQKYPGGIFEFAPRRGEIRGESAGFRPELACTGDCRFPVDRGQRLAYDPVNYWVVPERFQDCDLAEISVDRHGELFILSQFCQVIAKVNDMPLSGEEMTVGQVWSLPLELKSAQAFVVPDDDFFIVGLDHATDAPNLYYLKRPEAPVLPNT